jgi:hypothetical protein
MQISANSIRSGMREVKGKRGGKRLTDQGRYTFKAIFEGLS